MFVQNWNKNWKVWKEDNAFRIVQAVPADAKVVDLPYDPVFLQDQDIHSPNLGRCAFLNGGTWNFYKELDLSEEEEGSDIRLLFEGVGCNAYVFVNESMVCSHNYAYSQFYVDLSSYVRYGQKNAILVTATVLNENSRFYSGGGIYRDVTLLKGRDLLLEPETLHFTTLSLDRDEAEVLLDVDITNHRAGGAAADLLLEFYDAENLCLKRQCISLHLKGNACTHLSKRLSVSGILPWDETEPNLYQVSASLYASDGTLLDQEKTSLGFRTIQVDAQHGLRINGKETKLLGGCIHHDQGILGAATYDSYEYRRVKKLKEAGFNAVRCAHNPASKALLRACDRLGMYVLDETYDMWGRMKTTGDYSLFFSSSCTDVIRTMVQVDYNHPCVILYSIGNEIMDVATDRGVETGYELTSLFHTLDPSRPVTNAINGFLGAGSRLVSIALEMTGESLESIQSRDVNEFLFRHTEIEAQLASHPYMDEMLTKLDGTMDISGYNYMGDRYAYDCEHHPNRILLGTETHAKRIGDHWKLMQKFPQIIGDFIWAAHAYLGETGGVDNYPHLQNESCDLDIIGMQRPTNFYRQLQLGQRTDPYIAVRSPENSRSPMNMGPWMLTDAEPKWFYDEIGALVDVEVYFAGEKAELFLGTVSCGIKSGDSQGIARYRIPYQKENLTAVSYENGIENGRFCLSWKPAVSLQIHPEAYPCNDDLLFLVIQAENEDGDPVFTEIPALQIEISDTEALSLLAFGSYESPHNHGYQKTTLPVYSGCALAVVRKNKDIEVTVTVSAEHLKSASLCV